MSQPKRIEIEGRDVDPMLESIAREIVERTWAAAALEQALEGEFEAPEAREEALAALAEHRRELRRAESELRQLGWKRNPDRPLEFRPTARLDETVMAWRPEGTAFYRLLDVGISS